MEKFNLPKQTGSTGRWLNAFRDDLARIGITEEDIKQRGIPNTLGVPEGMDLGGNSYWDLAVLEFYGKPSRYEQFKEKEQQVPEQPEVKEETPSPDIPEAPPEPVAPSPEETPSTVNKLEPEPEVQAQVPEQPEVKEEIPAPDISEATAPEAPPEPVAPSPEEVPPTVLNVEPEKPSKPEQPVNVPESKPETKVVEEKKAPDIKSPVEGVAASVSAPPPPTPPKPPTQTPADKEPPHNLLDLSLAHERWLKKIYDELWAANKNLDRINKRLSNRLVRYGPGSGLAGRGGGGGGKGGKRAGDVLDENGNLIDKEGNIVEEQNIKYESPILQAIHDVTKLTKDPAKFVREKIGEAVGESKTFQSINEIKETFIDPFRRKGKILGDEAFPGIDPRRWSNLDAVLNLKTPGPVKPGFAAVPRMANIYRNVSSRIPSGIKLPKFAEGGVLKPVISSNNNVSIDSLNNISQTLANTNDINPFKLQLNQLAKPLSQSLTLPSKVGGGLILGVLDNVLTPLGPLLGPLGPKLPELFGAVSSGFGLNPGLVNSSVAAVKAQMQLQQSQQGGAEQPQTTTPPSTPPAQTAPSIPPSSTTATAAPSAPSKPSTAPSTTATAAPSAPSKPSTAPLETPASIKSAKPEAEMGMEKPSKPTMQPSTVSTTSQVANTNVYQDSQPTIVPIAMPQEEVSGTVSTPPNRAFVSSSIAFYVLQSFY